MDNRKPDPPPLATSDTATVGAGTLVWLVLLIAAVIDAAGLHRAGHDWWLATAATGTGLGLLGCAYTLRRTRRLGRAPADGAEQRP